MNVHVTVIGALIAAALPSLALAQAASPGTTLQQEMRHRRVIVRPVTPTEQVQQDIDQATAEIERQQATESVVRGLAQPPSRQPQLDPDLKGGIQTRSLNNVLRR